MKSGTIQAPTLLSVLVSSSHLLVLCCREAIISLSAAKAHQAAGVGGRRSFVIDEDLHAFSWDRAIGDNGKTHLHLKFKQERLF